MPNFLNDKQQIEPSSHPIRTLEERLSLLVMECTKLNDDCVQLEKDCYVKRLTGVFLHCVMNLKGRSSIHLLESTGEIVACSPLRIRHVGRASDISVIWAR
jgi:hypothetical protein